MRMGRMRFTYREPLEKLLSERIVATIRPYRRRQFERVKVFPGGYVATVVDCIPYSDDIAEKLVIHSGFSSLEEWKEAYRRLVGRYPDPRRDHIIVLKLGW